MAPALGPGIALLTPSRPNTPRAAGNAGAGGVGRAHAPGGTPKADKGLRHFSARVSAKVPLLYFRYLDIYILLGGAKGMHDVQ